MSAANNPGMHKSALQPQPQPQPQSHMVASNLANGHGNTASYQHTPALQTFSNDLAPAMSAPKRKRGRPRKQDLNIGMPLAIMSAPYPVGHPGSAGLVRPQAPAALPPPPSSATHQARKRKITSAGLGMNGFNAEVIIIQVGEDIARKVMSFSGNGWAACIMSANGAVSKVTLRQGISSHETTTYEGYFEIISLSGSYQPSKTGGMCSHTGGLGVLLASLDGRVFGGGVAGPLIASSPVQVVIGRFPCDEKKFKRVVTSDIPSASSSTLGGALNGSASMQA